MSQTVATFATIFFSMILVNNYVLVQFLGICPFLGVSKKLDSSVGMGAAVIAVMVIATAVTFPLQIFLLDANGLGYMQTVIFILVIAVLVQLIEIVLKRYVHALYQSLGVSLPLITTNCAVLGVAITNVQKEYGILTGIVNGFATALGFTIAIVILAGLREKMEYNEVPESFKGMPMVLLTAGLMAIAFCGFSGLI